MKPLHFKRVFFFGAALAVVGSFGVFFYLLKIGTPGAARLLLLAGDRTVFIESKKTTDEGAQEVQRITSCLPSRDQNSGKRLYAVMIAEDEEARPLSAISLADIVIEMPVVTGSVTRLMAIFACKDPVEIGSVRSARHDFVPLAQGFDAILAHWGGSHLALAELNKNTIDNLDALPNYFEAFYRKKGLSGPHNGFTSMERMVNAAEKMGYRLVSEFEGYKFQEKPKSTPSSDDAAGRMNGQVQSLEIGYRYPYNVRYEYDTDTNSYLRWRGGLQETDALTSLQVRVQNVVVMQAKSRQIGEGYNDVDILGEGKAAAYMEGEEISGTWAKKRASDVLRFFDVRGEEVVFTPGKIWIEVVEPTTAIGVN